MPSSPYNIDDLQITRDGVCASVKRTLKLFTTVLQHPLSSRTNIETFFGILIQEDKLLNSLDKSIVEVVDIDKLEKELNVAIQYEEAECHMRIYSRIALTSRP